MAHYVTCTICKKRFDRDKYPAVLVNTRRYAHASCAGALSEEQAKEEQDRQALEEYIIQLFNLKHMDGRITLQIKKFIQDYNYTYSGILRTLKYFYEVKKNDLSKSNNGIGIVPWVYQEAYNYYYNQWLLKQKNVDKNIEEYSPHYIDIVIKEPMRQPKKRKIFTFLDEEVEDAK